RRRRRLGWWQEAARRSPREGRESGFRSRNDRRPTLAESDVTQIRSEVAPTEADRNHLDVRAGRDVPPRVDDGRARREPPVRSRELGVLRRDEVDARLVERARAGVDLGVVHLDLEAALDEKVREQRRRAADREV